MDNQHKKIKGYRDLGQEEIDLMNRIKAKGAELLELHSELLLHLQAQQTAAKCLVEQLPDGELQRFTAAEPFRWAAIAKTDLQTGLMAMVRAVAQPEGC